MPSPTGCGLLGSCREASSCRWLLGTLRPLGVRPQDAGHWCVPTRLETRTKESNMCASIRVPNPDAKRNQEEGWVKPAPPAEPDLL